MPPSDPASNARPIIFFDGVCGLCNRFVSFLLRADRRQVFRFAPLQGETALRTLAPASDDTLSTVRLVADGRVYERSEAVLRILARLGLPWRLAAVALLLPASLRDAVYGFVARHRYRWFGRQAHCRVPGPAERARFLP